jgi:hypothetical protein
MSGDFQRTTWCYIPEDRTLHNHRCEHLKSYVTDNLHEDLTGLLNIDRIDKFFLKEGIIEELKHI